MKRDPDLILTEDHFIAEGNGRLVYRHPDNKNLVIKIQKPRKQKPFGRLRNMTRRLKRRFLSISVSWIEVDEYAAIVARTGRTLPFCVQFRGFVDTNQGMGCLFDLVLAPDGSIAPTLGKFAITNPRTPQITAAIDELWDGIHESGAVVWDPNLNNVMVAGSVQTGLRLVLVDGTGERTAVPVMSLFSSARLKTNKAFRAEMKHRFDAVTRNAAPPLA